jgi:hypothetical protein
MFIVMKNAESTKKFFDLVYPNFKGTCIEFINGIMQVC